MVIPYKSVKNKENKKCYFSERTSDFQLMLHKHLFIYLRLYFRILCLDLQQILSQIFHIGCI